MPNLDDRIDGFVAGTDFNIYRTITGVSVGDPIATCYFTVKRRLQVSSVNDDDAIIKKTITTSFVADQGKILSNGSAITPVDADDTSFVGANYPAGTARVRFDIRGANSILLKDGAERPFDIKVVTASNLEGVPFSGMMQAVKPVTLVP